MKRIFVSTILLLALSLTARHVAAQPAPENVPLDAAKKQYREAEDRAATVLEKYLNTVKKAPSDDRQDLRGKLQPLVEETFRARQRLQRAELAELRRRMTEIENAIEEREKNKDAIINSRLDELLNPQRGQKNVRYEYQDRIENGERVRIAQPVVEATRPVPEGARDDRSVIPQSGRQRAEDPFSDPRSRREERSDPQSRTSASSDDFDLETRERLTQLDFHAAEEDYTAAEKNLSLLRKHYESGGAPASAVHEAENDCRHAKVQLDRAKVKLEGLARQRADLSAAADVAVAEAEAEVQKAQASVQGAMAACEAVVARAKTLGSEVATAEAALDHRQKEYLRTKELYEQGAVPERTLAEAEEKLEAAKASLDKTRVGIVTSKTDIAKSDARRNEELATLRVAETRLRAAQQRRDRLIQQGAVDNVQPAAQERP